VRTASGGDFGLADPTVTFANGRIWVVNFTSDSLTELPPG
jgi:hypothetical protein